jgi:hypothetical protein
MKVKVVKKARQSLLAGINVHNKERVQQIGIFSGRSLAALKREICTDQDQNWLQIRSQYITAGQIKAFIPKTVKGAETRNLKRKHAMRTRIDGKFNAQEGREMQTNPDILRGRQYQLEAAMVYSAVTGYTVAPIGCLVGPLPCDGDFPAVPDTISGTLDYIVLEDDIVVEVKCPRKFNKDWSNMYFAQPQVQMQLARCRKAHIVQYIPPTFEKRGAIYINRFEVDHKWFATVCPLVEVCLKHIKSKISQPEVNKVETEPQDDIYASREYEGSPKLPDPEDEAIIL